MQSLREAHKLLDRHVQSINKHSELEAVAHLELDEIKTECQSLKESLGKEQGEKQLLEDTLECKKKKWDDQVFSRKWWLNQYLFKQAKLLGHENIAYG